MFTFERVGCVYPSEVWMTSWLSHCASCRKTTTVQFFLTSGWPPCSFRPDERMHECRVTFRNFRGSTLVSLWITTCPGPILIQSSNKCTRPSGVEKPALTRKCSFVGGFPNTGFRQFRVYRIIEYKASSASLINFAFYFSSIFFSLKNNVSRKKS